MIRTDGRATVAHREREPLRRRVPPPLTVEHVRRVVDRICGELSDLQARVDGEIRDTESQAAWESTFVRLDAAEALLRKILGGAK